MSIKINGQQLNDAIILIGTYVGKIETTCICRRNESCDILISGYMKLYSEWIKIKILEYLSSTTWICIINHWSIKLLIKAFYQAAIMRLMSQFPTNYIECSLRSFLISRLSQLIDQTANDRTTFFAVTFDMWQGDSAKLDYDTYRGASRTPLLKKIADARDRCFRESVEPRREKVLKNDDRLNSCTRSIDQSIRRVIDTNSSHVSITRTHLHHAMRLASSRHQ